MLATAIEAMDAGLRVILAADALDQLLAACHAKALDILHDASTSRSRWRRVDEILAAWQ